MKNHYEPLKCLRGNLHLWLVYGAGMDFCVYGETQLHDNRGVNQQKLILTFVSSSALILNIPVVRVGPGAAALTEFAHDAFSGMKKQRKQPPLLQKKKKKAPFSNQSIKSGLGALLTKI